MLVQARACSNHRPFDCQVDGDGTVTVARANIAGLYFRGLIFWDLSGYWTLVLSGLPRGVIPYIGIDSDGNGISDGVSLLPDGSWQIAETAIPYLKLPPVRHYSGEQPYLNLKKKLRALTQEVDGDQSLIVSWDIFIDVEPVADGIRNFNTSITGREGALETPDGKLSLAKIGQHGLTDSDSSERLI